MQHIYDLIPGTMIQLILASLPVMTGDPDRQANIYQQDLLSAAAAFLFVLGL